MFDMLASMAIVYYGKYLGVLIKLIFLFFIFYWQFSNLVYI
jgi:hypothetical protein